MPGARNFSPELKRRNRFTLAAFMAIACLLAAAPLAVRLLTRPIPALSDSARGLFPDEAGAAPGLTLYGAADSDLTAAVGAMLDTYSAAVQTVFPEAARPVEIALLDDAVQARQVWIQVFGRDDRRLGVRGVGRSTFVLYDASAAASLDPGEQAAEVAHFLGRALLEQKLEERLRLVPEPYAHLIGEMMAVALMPDLAGQAQRDYETLRASEAALTEKAWLASFDGEPGALAIATTRLIAAEFVASPRRRELVALLREGYGEETAFRAVAAGLVSAEARAANTPPQSVPGTSFDDMVERLERRIEERRSGGEEGQGGAEAPPASGEGR